MKDTVLITGCSTGFGRAAARLFHARGFNVVATMRRPDASDELHRLDDVLVTRLDVQDRASIDDAVRATIDRFGRVDVLVNNAGFGLHGVFEATPREKIAEQFEVNLFGVMDVTRAVLPQMRKQRRGAIVNVSSGAGVFTLPMMSMYSASKFALEGFSESLWYELWPLGITVKVVEPGGVVATKFVERSTTEAGLTTSIDDYAPFLTHTAKVFDGLKAARDGATEDGVAEVLVAAATDRSERLRYVATEGIVPLVRARRESSEDAYRALMVKQFGFTPAR